VVWLIYPIILSRMAAVSAICTAFAVWNLLKHQAFPRASQSRQFIWRLCYCIGTNAGATLCFLISAEVAVFPIVTTDEATNRQFIVLVSRKPLKNLRMSLKVLDVYACRDIMYGDVVVRNGKEILHLPLELQRKSYW
jgi:hypothetical protein